MIDLNPEEQMEEEKKAKGLETILHGKAGRWNGEPELKEAVQEAQHWWLELLINRYRRGKTYLEVLRNEGEAGLLTMLRNTEEQLKNQLGAQLYEFYPEKPDRHEAERCMYFYRVVKARGIIVPEEPTQGRH